MVRRARGLLMRRQTDQARVLCRQRVMRMGAAAGKPSYLLKLQTPGIGVEVPVVVVGGRWLVRRCRRQSVTRLLRRPRR